MARQVGSIAYHVIAALTNDYIDLKALIMLSQNAAIFESTDQRLMH